MGTHGNALYFHAKALDSWFGQEEEAFGEYLRVQQYPACLVYTAGAYIHAADILNGMGQPENALALLAVDVPNIDWPERYSHRHLISADILINEQRFDQALQQLAAAGQFRPESEDEIVEMLVRIPSYCVDRYAEEQSVQWDNADNDAAIVAGLTNSMSTPDDAMYYDAITHEWPPLESVADMIATNRALNNNVFPQLRRELSEDIRQQMRNVQ
jgi:hypothetical protein